MMATYLQQFRDCHEAHLADTLLQPVELSYTVKSLSDLADRCGLKMVLPCLNIHDKTQDTLSWNMRFDDPDLRARYEALPDLDRWQLSNCLMLDRSPMLWFYLQHKDSPNALKPEQQVAEEFLDTVFVPVETSQQRYVRREDGTYRKKGGTIPFPLKPTDPRLIKIVEGVDGRRTMRAIFRKLGLRTSFQLAHWARIHLTTPIFPHLRAVVNHPKGHREVPGQRTLAERRGQRLRHLKMKARRKS